MLNEIKLIDITGHDLLDIDNIYLLTASFNLCSMLLPTNTAFLF